MALALFFAGFPTSAMVNLEPVVFSPYMQMDGLEAGGDGSIYFSDTNNYRIWRIGQDGAAARRADFGFRISD